MAGQEDTNSGGAASLLTPEERRALRASGVDPDEVYVITDQTALDDDPRLFIDGDNVVTMYNGRVPTTGFEITIPNDAAPTEPQEYDGELLDTPRGLVRRNRQVEGPEQ